MGTRTDIDHLAERRILYNPLLPRAVTNRAGVHPAARFRSVAAASAACIFLRHLNFHFRAEGGLLKGDIYVIAQVRPALRSVRLSGTTAAAEKDSNISPKSLKPP